MLLHIVYLKRLNKTFESLARKSDKFEEIDMFDPIQ
jgi:hypothetical protein